jgi:alkylation response protein AidB-like acyl-CoA dehydrogenase
LSASALGFEPSAEQATLVEAVRRFATRELRPHAREADESGRLPDGFGQSGWELGLLPASIPEAHGGFGERSAVTGVLAAEELGWGDVSGALALLSPGLVALPVLLCGSGEQKSELLPLFCGETYAAGSAALLEPRYDFDPQTLRTTARREGGGYVLAGTKCNVPCAAEAEWMLVYAALDGATQAFLVRRGTQGLNVGERERNLGLNALPLYAVELQDCVVPASQRLGGEAGADFPLLLSASRVALGALAVGVARAAYEYGLEYARRRTAFGEPIARRQAIAFMLAEMATEVEAARLMVWEAAWRLDQGQDAGREAALAKNFADEMSVAVTDRAVQILGGHGYIRDYPVEMWLRNARGFAVLEGLAVV